MEQMQKTKEKQYEDQGSMIDLFNDLKLEI